MRFTQISSREAQQPRRQGPAKLVVTVAPNGRAQINLSAAVRDHLQPVKKFRVSLLVDKVTRQLAVVRAADGSSNDNDFEVNGSPNSSMYIFGNALDEWIGLQAGHYLAELTTLPEANNAPAVIIDIDHRVDPSTTPTGINITPTSTRMTTTSEERQRIAVIDQILNEGVVVVSTVPPTQDSLSGS